MNLKFNSNHRSISQFTYELLYGTRNAAGLQFTSQHEA